MRRILKAIIWLAAVVLVGLGLLRLYQYSLKSAPETEGSQGQRSGPPLVRVARVRTETVEQRVFVTGTIGPDASAMVVPEVAGVLQQFRLADGTPVKEGLKVKRGDLMAVVEHRDLEVALDEAKANLRLAQASLREAQIQLDDTSREKQRMAALFKEGTATEQQRDRAVTAFETARARVELAGARVKQAEAALERARLRYEDATVEAPIEGVIAVKYVDEGGYVGPSTPLAKLVDIRHVEVEGSIASRYLPLLEAGTTQVRLQVDVYPDELFTGKVDRVRPELDPVTRTATVTARIGNEDEKLKPGMFARMQIVLRRREGVPVVPDAALVETTRAHKAFVADRGRVHLRAVRIGLEAGDRNEVLDGLSPGEYVVTSGHQLLEDGMEVQTQLEARQRLDFPAGQRGQPRKRLPPHKGPPAAREPPLGAAR